ncbi:MAG: M28 family peptidase [Gemmatimonadota bacterium]
MNSGRARQDSVFGENGQFVRMETDSIFNGADDDASGTIAVVEVAEAFSMLARPPRRSMIFLTVSGEEKGLLGSRWFANHPTVPIEDIVANFNTDMIGRNWTDTVVVIGKEHSELGQIMNQVGGEHPELDMAPIDDRWPEQSFYTRSDHFNFARRGVPVLFFFTGTHDDYHQATDEVRRIEGDKAARIAKLVFYLSEEVANMDRAPMWYDDSYDEYVSDAPEGAPRRSRPREEAAPSN